MSLSFCKEKLYTRIFSKFGCFHSYAVYGSTSAFGRQMDALACPSATDHESKCPHFHSRSVYCNKGVSIAEMVVVVAIVALLAALIAGAVNIKNASELRSFITDINQFQVAIDGFSLKYDDLPGDMPDAEDYWQSSVTDNGDADNFIEYAVVSSEVEALRAWQHLNLAGYIEGGYSGTATVDDDQADIGLNVPSSRRSRVGYFLNYQDMVGRGSRNEIVVGAFEANKSNENAALTPQEANAIDKKMDDGNPTNGVVYAEQGNDIGSELCQNVAGDAYRLTQEDFACIMSFSINP